MRDSRSESFRRAILLSLLSEEQQTRILEKRVTSVLNGVMWLVEGIFEDYRVAALESDLQGFVKLAYIAWQSIHRLQDRFETNMDYTFDNSIDWGTLPFDDSEESNDEGNSTASGASDEPVLVVFPRMYMVKDSEPKLVTPGVVLMKSQTVTAAKEVRSEASRSPTFGRGIATFSRDDRRRDSMIINDSLANGNAATFLGQGLPDGQSH